MFKKSKLTVEKADPGILPNHGIVGSTVSLLEGQRNTLEGEVDMLTRHITDLIETRRQAIASLKAITVSLVTLSGDISLTPEQAKIADREIVVSLADLRIDEE
ncbi:hypothetical protein Ab1vBOLIVR4_gp19c [Agrobacterium phage OLIVR4]|nr:hypothetical protein Ab1vBOLIVR4_gp19c [Agrobacterium phage OLIVR4]